jgi:hypothetical protein
MLLIVGAVGLIPNPSLRAVGPPPGSAVPVVYNPDTLQSAQGDAPFSFQYTLQVTSPASLPAGLATTVTVNLAVTNSPAGSDQSTALGFVTFSQTTLQFTGPGQTRQISVYVNIPAGSIDGDFTYLITTPGWPAGYAIVDNGTRINAHVNPPSGLVPPTVAINSPANGTLYVHEPGAPAIQVPITVSGGATDSAVLSALTATLTGYDSANTLILPTQSLNLVLTGLGTAQAVGVVAGGFPVSTPGIYTLSATAVNPVGSSTTTSTFIVVEDTPVFSTLSGIVFADTNLDGIRQPGESGLAGVVVTLKNSAGAMIATAITAAGGGYSFTVTPGTYIVSAGAVSGYVLTTANNHAVAVSGPAVTAPDTGFGADIQHTPTTLSGVVFYDANSNGARDLPADYGLAGVAVQLLSSANAVIATVATSADGSYSFGVLPGTYSIGVAGVAGLIKTTASPLPYNIVVTGTPALAPQTGYGPQAVSTLSGTVFFDVNFNGVRNTGDYGLEAFAVKLMNAAGTAVVATTATGANGTYAFAGIAPGNYLVSVTGIPGLSPTTLTEWSVSVTAASVTAPDTGFGLNFAAIRTMSSAALSQGFWKNNVSKNLAKKPNGTQVSLADMQTYTALIATLGLAPFNGLTMTAADTVFSGKVQLQLQLLAAEYNYVSGAYIGGSRTLTYAFIYWGETVMQNTGGVYNAAYQTFTASWMEAYDTSEGGKVLGPLP